MAMRTALQPRKQLSPKSAQPSPEDLLRTLVGQLPKIISDSEQVCSEGSECEEVIFDVVMDGAHYLLVRLPRVTRPHVQLSPREQEIVRMVALGHPNKVIADVLSISSWTVCTHLRRIFAKLGVGSRAAMVARILENGNGRKTAAAKPIHHAPDVAAQRIPVSVDPVQVHASMTMAQRGGGR